MLRRHHWTSLVAFTALSLALSVFPATPGAAAETDKLDKLDASLKLIPDDAAFYSAMLRNREQIEIIRKSKAWARLCQMPVVQMGLALYQMQQASPDTPAGKLNEALNNPEVRKIVDLLADMTSDEIFIYGDEGWVKTVDLFQKLNAANTYAPLLALVTDGPAAVNNANAKGKAVIAALADDLESLEMPGLVLGFKLKNADLAKEQLIKLETIGNLVLETNENTKGRFKKQKLGSHDFLVLELDGGMIPWDEVPLDKFKEMEAEEGDVEKIVDHLKESKLVVALGLRDNYLLISIGSSTDPLEKLGSKDRLIDSDAFKPLDRFADRRLTSIGYVSEEMNQQLHSNRQNLDNLAQLAHEALGHSQLPEAKKNKILTDVQALAKDAQKMIPEVEAAMSFSFLTDRGLEGYQYAWGDHGRFDGTQSLSLLHHIGGNPIVALVARQNLSLTDYDVVSRWAKTGYDYFEEFALPAIPEADREKVKKLVALAMPLVRRFDKANREMLIPAMADGQVGLVLDGKLTSNRFLASQPATKTAMPMVEPALIFGISNADLLKKAFAEYRAIVNGLIDVGRQVDGSKIPTDVQLPAPKTTSDPLGTIYSYEFPAEWGVDQKIVFNIGVSDKVAAITISHDHTRRLLQKTPPAVSGVLTQLDRPLACAGWFDWAALMDKISPWADFAIEQAAASRNQDGDHVKTIADQVHTALDLLKCFRAASSETYVEDDVLVQHELFEFRDLAQ